MKQNYNGISATALGAKPHRTFGLGRIGAALVALGLSFGAQAQGGQSLFRADAEAKAAAAGTPLAGALLHAQALSLDVAVLRAVLAQAPQESATGEAPLVLRLPLPDGRTQRFAVRETMVMAPDLAARYPQIKTYAGHGLDDARASVRLDLTPQGFHGQVLTADAKSFYIDPVTRTDTRHYLAFYTRDMNRAAAGSALKCGFAPTASDEKAVAQVVEKGLASARTLVGSGSQLKTYRLALANTPEYAVTKGNTLAGVIAGEVTSVNRVVGVYEKELAVRLVLVRENDRLVFLNGTGPQPPVPYSNSNGSAMLGQNQTNVDQLVGSANYDIGHVFSTGGGGVAYLGAVCNNLRKAGGVTGSPSPVGDAFDIDYVAHEIGHQFAGTHPFNGDAGSCAGGNRTASTAWEPGSGSTIMAYAGICTPSNDLQPNSDPVFHTGSFEQMRAFITGTTCAVNTATGNTSPTVTAPASGKTMPIGTPFKLTASATDAENDPLTYMWEELDLGPQGSPTASQVANQNIPLFRSFVPTASPTRYFPRLSNLLANTTNIGERLPTVSRLLRFRCTARDEHAGPAGVIGGVDYSSLVTLNVTSTAGPFVVSFPNTAVSWIGGAAQTVTWNVAGTDAAPVSCALVNIRLSLDGGLTYPTVLATNVPNNGSAVVVAPSPATAQTQARIMVEAADNYFFDISNADFTISPAATGPTITSFTPTGGPVGTVVTILGSNFTGATAVAFNGTAASSYTVNSATQITATVAAGTTTGPITITAPTGTATSSTSFFVGVPPVITSFTPTTGAAGTSVVITGTDFTGATQVSFNGTAAPTYTVNSSTQITVTVPAGATTGTISVTTPIGTATSSGVFTVISPPTITSFTPTAGSVGTTVTITGTNFTGATAVTLNGVAITGFTVVNATTITFAVPTGATTGPIAVTGPGGTATSTTNFAIPPANDLCANAIALTCGQSVSGTTVGATATGDPTVTCATTAIDAGGVFYTITGTGGSITLSTCDAGTSFDTKLFVFSGACGVYTCVASNDDVTCGPRQFASSLTFPSAVGTVYRVFVSGYGANTGTFVLSATCGTPVPVPTITSLTPNTGPIASSIQINGTNFTGATSVTFNGTPATTFNVTSATSMTAVVPAGATTGNVVGTTAGGSTNGITGPVAIPAPRILGMNPTSGSAGTVVTLTGTNFTGATSVALNGTAAVVFTVVNATTITFTVPVGATSGNVIVTTPSGSNTAAAVNLFTVTVGTSTARANRSEFSVSPNPVAGKQNIHVKLATAATSARATLCNVLGQTVATSSFSGKTAELSTTGLASGTYLLTVQTDSRTPSIQRIVVE